MASEPPSYVRFFRLLKAIREAVPFREMSADEERMLCDLILRWHEIDLLTVKKVISSSYSTSSSSAYRRLRSLQEKGLVDLRVDQEDKRIKYVEPTAKARQYVRQLESSLNDIGDHRTSS